MKDMEYRSRAVCRAALVVSAVIMGLGIVVVMSPGGALAGEASLNWDPNVESDLAGYYVYHGTASGSYGAPMDAGVATTYTVTGLTDGVTYYFSVTARDVAGNESGYSNEVSKTIGGGAPGAIRPRR